MDQRIYAKIAFKPCRIGVLGPLVHRKRDRSDQGNARHRCGNSSKEASKFLCLIGVFHTVRKIVVFVCLHSSFHGIQWELEMLSRNSSYYWRSKSYSEECGQDTAEGRSNLCSVSLKPSLRFSSSLCLRTNLRIVLFNPILLIRLHRHNGRCSESRALQDNGPSGPESSTRSR